jgi:hypothetical protein
VDAGGHARRLVLAVLGDGGEHAQAHLGMRTDREDGVGGSGAGLRLMKRPLAARMCHRDQSFSRARTLMTE